MNSGFKFPFLQMFLQAREFSQLMNQLNPLEFIVQSPVFKSIQ